ALAPPSPPAAGVSAATSSTPTVAPTSSGPGAGLPAAPVLDPPPPATADGTITLTGRLREPLPAAGSHQLRVYVNDRLRRQVRIGRRETEFRVRDVPLARGTNTITAVVRGRWGTTLHSAPVVVERDDAPPSISQLEPSDGTAVYAGAGEPAVLVAGLTEPAARVGVHNTTAGAVSSIVAGSDGRFAVSVRLALGLNEIVVSSVDRAGNSSQATIAVELRPSAAGVALQLSRDSFEVSRLPAMLTVLARVTGDDGTPIDGAEVVFSISAPGQMTATYTTTTRFGTAGWHGFQLPREGAVRGRGLVTVLATLPSGETLRNSAPFTFR
ncbi:MAG: hypothetical protein M3N29_05320, partial [Chloroflexota bacterium]|nr:hypothetical protein [Chloroflexota bacterium]